MGLSIAVVSPQNYQRPEPFGANLKQVVADITFDSSYPTNGEALAPATVGLREIVGITQINKDTGFAGHDVIYDAANDKLLAYDDEGAEVANTTDLSTLTTRVLIVGY